MIRGLFLALLVGASVAQENAGSINVIPPSNNLSRPLLSSVSPLLFPKEKPTKSNSTATPTATSPSWTTTTTPGTTYHPANNGPYSGNDRYFEIHPAGGQPIPHPPVFLPLVYSGPSQDYYPLPPGPSQSYPVPGIPFRNPPNNYPIPIEVPSAQFPISGYPQDYPAPMPQPPAGPGIPSWNPPDSRPPPIPVPSAEFPISGPSQSYPAPMPQLVAPPGGPSWNPPNSYSSPVEVPSAEFPISGPPQDYPVPMPQPPAGPGNYGLSAQVPSNDVYPLENLRGDGIFEANIEYFTKDDNTFAIISCPRNPSTGSYTWILANHHGTIPKFGVPGTVALAGGVNVQFLANYGKYEHWEGPDFSDDETRKFQRVGCVYGQTRSFYVPRRN